MARLNFKDKIELPLFSDIKVLTITFTDPGSIIAATFCRRFFLYSAEQAAFNAIVNCPIYISRFGHILQATQQSIYNFMRIKHNRLILFDPLRISSVLLGKITPLSSKYGLGLHDRVRDLL